MKKRIRRAGFLLLTISIFACENNSGSDSIATSGAVQAGEAVPEGKDEWVDLFDGKSLSGLARVQ